MQVVFLVVVVHNLEEQAVVEQVQEIQIQARQELLTLVAEEEVVDHHLHLQVELVVQE